MYLDAEKAPFFIQKLQVQVLPTMICFIDGVAVDRVVGFADMGNKDEFPTILLARRLIQAGVIRAVTKEEQGRIRIKKGKEESDDEDY